MTHPASDRLASRLISALTVFAYSTDSNVGLRFLRLTRGSRWIISQANRKLGHYEDVAHGGHVEVVDLETGLEVVVGDGDLEVLWIGLVHGVLEVEGIVVGIDNLRNGDDYNFDLSAFNISYKPNSIG